MLLIASQECDDDGTFTVRYEDGETQDGNCRRHTPIDLALTLLQMEILHTVPQLRDFDRHYHNRYSQVFPSLSCVG